MKKMVKNVRMKQMSWIDIQESMQVGYTTVILPIGSIEQHGPHLPTGTDTYLGEFLGTYIAKQLGNALVAPVIRPGCSQHHMAFPGTITLSPQTLMQIIKEVCKSLNSHGFENIVLLPSHGGNFAPVDAIVPELVSEVDSNIIPMTDLKAMLEIFVSVMETYGVSEAESGVHAGAAETSLIMEEKPELVNYDLLKTGYLGDFEETEIFRKGIKALSAIGVLGDPKKATKEAGKTIFEKVAEEYAKRIKKKLGD